MEQEVINWGFEDLRQRYLQRKLDDTSKLNELISQNDYEEIRRMAHQGIGNCSMYGFESLQETYTQILQYAKEERTEMLQVLSARFHDNIQGLIQQNS